MRIHLPSILLCVSVAFMSCSVGHATDDEEDIALAADSFVYGYFNFDFSKAVRFCTPESGKWLKFRATNVLQEDIDIIKAQQEGATYAINEIKIIDDTTATVDCKVFNYLQTDTLGRPGCMKKSGRYKFKAVKRTGKWLIKMEGLPQNGRRNRG